MFDFMRPDYATTKLGIGPGYIMWTSMNNLVGNVSVPGSFCLLLGQEFSHNKLVTVTAGYIKML